MKLTIPKKDFQCQEGDICHKPFTNEGQGVVQGKMSVHIPLKKCDEWLQKEWSQKCPREQGEDEARKADCGTGEWRAMMARITRAT